MKNIKAIHQIAYHRNGVSGEGFHAVIFDGAADEGRMVAFVFPSPFHVAVVNVDKLADPAIGVTFGENSWRGDRYERELREAIKEWSDAQ